MADPFAAQLSAFKKSLKGASTELPPQKRASPAISPPIAVTAPVVNAKNTSTTSNATDINSSNVKLSSPTPKLPKNDTSMSNSQSSGNLTMKLMTSSDYIKSKDRPVPVYELETSLGLQVDPQLIKCLSNVDRIKYTPENSSFQYLSLHNIKTGDDLVKVLQNQPAFAGLSVKQLKDGWNNCLQTIDELEKENKIIVHKTKKDNSPRHIWLNPDQLPIKVYNGVQSIQTWDHLMGNNNSNNNNNNNNGNGKSNGSPSNKVKSLDMIFYELWNNVSIPNHDDLVKLLIDNGLKPTNVEPESMKNKKIKTVKERKQKRTRRAKITNLHMKGILKDYSGKLK